MTLVLPIVAIDDQLIAGAVGVVIVVGSMIANWLKAQSEAKRQQQEGEAAGDDEMDGAERGEAMSLEQRAASRREQLRREIQHRQAGGGAGRQEPGNLTASERSERERAREAYRRRAEQLRQGGGGTASSREGSDRVGPERRGRVEDERRAQESAEAEARRRREAYAERLRQRQAEEASARERRVREMAARQGVSGRSSNQPIGPGAGEMSPETLHVLDHAKEAAARIKDSAAITGASAVIGGGSGLLGEVRRTSRGGGMKLKLGSRASLRQAIVMKEVLDRPLALRDPEAGSMY